MRSAAAPYKPPEAVVPKLAWILTAIAVSALTLLTARQFLLYLPADHFCADGRRDVLPAKRWAKRIAGVALIVLGILLALPGIPGQGLLLVLIGLMLLDAPLLRRLELRLLRVPMVHRSVNKLRVNAGKPPLQLPDDTDTPT